jgi:ATP-dependent RNA helicase RhlE
MGFKALSLSPHILQTLETEGYSTPTPIQAEAIPHVLAGKDVLGVAQTGTGKTAAFALPMIQRLLDPTHKILGAGEQPSEAHNVAKAARKIRALILSPTRELASQIEESFKTYGRGTSLRYAVIFGGVSAHWQIKSLFHGVDIVVATPGRLLDLMMQGYVDLRYVQTFVLDEADQMLDMGFINDIRKIIAKLPTKRQNLLFSATMPSEIRQLADNILKNPVTVQVTPIASTVQKIQQSVYYVDKGAKPSMLVKYIKDNGISRALVFTRTKHGADKVARYLDKAGIRSAALHGNKTQGQRRRAMELFQSQKPPILVATDIAARGLDIDEISHVVNYDVPNIPETYVHRIGRTGRAGASGMAVSFVDSEERAYLRDIERLTKQKIPVAGEAEAPAGTHAEGALHITPGSERRPQGPSGSGHRPLANKPNAGANGQGHRAGGGQGGHGHGPRSQQSGGHRQSSGQRPTQGHGGGHKPAGGRPAAGGDAGQRAGGRPQSGGQHHAPRAQGGGGGHKPAGNRGPWTGGPAKRPHRKGPSAQGGARRSFGR